MPPCIIFKLISKAPRSHLKGHIWIRYFFYLKHRILIEVIGVIINFNLIFVSEIKPKISIIFLNYFYWPTRNVRLASNWVGASSSSSFFPQALCIGVYFGVEVAVLCMSWTSSCMAIASYARILRASRNCTHTHTKCDSTEKTALRKRKHCAPFLCKCLYIFIWPSLARTPPPKNPTHRKRENK